MNLNTTRKFVISKYEHFCATPKAENIEKCIYNYSIHTAKQKCIPRKWENIKFRKLYLQKYRSILYNIQRNIDILKIGSKKLVESSPQELAPEVWETSIANVERKRRGMVILDEDEEHEGLYKCPRCKSKNTSFYSLQTRGADEPMTNFITCKKCEYHWKD